MYNLIIKLLTNIDGEEWNYFLGGKIKLLKVSVTVKCFFGRNCSLCKRIFTTNSPPKKQLHFEASLQFCVGPHSEPFWARCGPWAAGWTPLI